MNNDITDEMRARVAMARGWQQVHGVWVRHQNSDKFFGENAGKRIPPYDTDGNLILELIEAYKISIGHSKGDEQVRAGIPSDLGYELYYGPTIGAVAVLATIAWIDAQDVEK